MCVCVGVCDGVCVCVCVCMRVGVCDGRHFYLLVVCLRTNGERALNYTIVIQTTEIKLSC